MYNRDDRLVLALADQPGEFNFAKMPDEDAEIVECSFATLQCYESKAEAELLNLLFRSQDIEEFLERLKANKYKVRPGRPQPYKFARL